MPQLKGKKVLLYIIPVIISLALIASFVTMSAWAQEPEAEERLEMAPVSLQYQAYQQEPRGEFYGYIPPPIDLSHLEDIPVESPISIKPLALPAYFDWRYTDNVTPVKNQNPCGTCWLFGTLAAVEAKVLIGESVGYDFSEQNLACCTDPSWVYLSGNRCNGGGWSWLAADTLTKKGTRLESCDSYNGTTIDTEACNDSCTTVKLVTGYRLVALTTELIKESVYYQGPVSVAFRYDSGHFNPDTNIYYYPNCHSSPNHLVCIVGWDESIAHPAGGGSGAWIVKNSWGTDWGGTCGYGSERGYFYLCYGSGNMQEVASYQYTDYDSLEKVYYWDEAGWVDSLGYLLPDRTTAWMANVFTVVQGGNLTDVDFWATSNNAGYEIYVYNDGDPSDGLQELDLLTSQSGTCQEAGYYSIALTSPVSLTTGQQFTIAVKMTTPGYDYPIPVEYELTGTFEPPIQAGVSYIRHGDMGIWTDLAASGYNACLRARIYSLPTYVATIHIVSKDDDSAVGTITFPEGSPGAIISNPYNGTDGSDDPQVLDGGSSEPVVRLKNTSEGTLTVWLSITDWTNGIVTAEDYELVDTGNNTIAAVTQVLSANGGASSANTSITIDAGEYKDLYLEVTLVDQYGKSGGSTLTILGE